MRSNSPTKTHREIKYTIEPHEEFEGLWVLSSIVDTDFGGPAKNYVADGTLDYVERVMRKLQNELG